MSSQNLWLLLASYITKNERQKYRILAEMRFRRRLLSVIPSSCAADSCTNRDVPSCPYGLFRFPLSDEERTKLWIKGVCCRRAVDWWPTSGMRICRKHFVEGKPSEDPSGVDYVLTIVNIKKGAWKMQKQLVQVRAKDIRKGAGRGNSPRYWHHLLKCHQLVLLELRKRNRLCVATYPRRTSMSSCFFLLLKVIFNILRRFCSTGTVALSKLFQRDCASMVDLRDSPRASTSIAIIVTLLQLDYNYNNAYNYYTVPYSFCLTPGW